MIDDLQDRLAKSSVAFRGYNVTNLGRTLELLRHGVYRPTMHRYLTEASAICSEAMGRQVDLISRVEREEETSLATYDEAVAMIVAVELAQVKLLREHFGVDLRKAKVMYGYSLGEITALCVGGLTAMKDALQIPLALCRDCAELADDVAMGVVFSRGDAIDQNAVNRLCVRINGEGRGVIGTSSILSPNSLLMLGQGDTIARFKDAAREAIGKDIHVRKNPHTWPPLHTPIMWQRHIPNRSAVLMQTLPSEMHRPRPPIISMVTGRQSYNDYNWREIIHRWIDHPQRVWDVVYQTLSLGIETVIHVGPQPNLIPATFRRLAENVQAQTSGVGGLGARAVAGMARRLWLAKLLPKRAALLRAASLQHVVLEDWLLEHEPTE
jgi:[acyl-carrier-protein] S-malonyltransferase